MKNFILVFLIGTSSLIGEETSFYPLPQSAEKLTFLEEQQSQFFYFSGGLTMLPTVSVGYRKIYGSFGSDFSISGSVLPRIGGFSGFVMPGAHYKQLFFPGNGLQTRKSAFYLGAKTGLYAGFSRFNDAELFADLGGLGGIQIKRKKGYDFFEAGLSPVIYCFDKGHRGEFFLLVPLFSISYGIMF
ncbi:MAG: hypothetical protein V4487_04505 [Chlamydiota bacterium]